MPLYLAQDIEKQYQ